MNIGEVFGRLTVLSPETEYRYLCRCECGKKKIIAGSSLRSGNTRSCGCLNTEKIRKRSTVHGMCNTPEYNAYRSAKARCQNENNEFYADYGGRGIEFRFLSFSEFLATLGPRPSSAYSLDREKVNGHYEPGNVRWATAEQQVHNRRRCGSIHKFSTEELKAELARRGELTCVS